MNKSMEASVDAIEKLRAEKRKILDGVYTEKDIDEVYRRQTALNAMGISIYTDVAEKLLPALEADGVNVEVWADISGGLKKLSFKGIPAASEIRTKYKEAIDASMSAKYGGDYEVEPKDGNAYSKRPAPKTQIEIKGKPLPKLLFAIQAIMEIPVPLVLTVAGVKWNVLAKIILIANGVAMTIEIIHYFRKYCEKTERNRKKSDVGKGGEPVSGVNYDEWYQKAIEQVQEDNTAILDQWFDDLKKKTIEEAAKARRRRENNEYCS